MTATEKAQILAGVGKLTLAKLRALVSLNPTPTHTNKDSYYSPAQWWVDTDHTVRHRLDTSAGMSMSDATITINLTYTIVDISSS